MLTKNLDKGNIKFHNRHTYLKQVQFFKTLCEELGIKYPTIGTF